MSLWDPILDGPSKHQTFGQLLCRGMCDLSGRGALTADLRQMVRAGRVAEAIAEAKDSDYSEGIGFGAIAAEQANLGDIAGALDTAELITDHDNRATAMIDIAETCRRASDTAAADTALAKAFEAARKIRGVGWRHWRARCLAKIGLVKHRLGQPDAARRFCRLALDVATKQRGETRNQTLGDVVRAFCLIGDVESAAMAIQEMDQEGPRSWAVAVLAATYVAGNQVEVGLKALADVSPHARSRAMVEAGRMLARPRSNSDVEELRRDLPEIDQLRLLVGYGSALQDLGRYAEAAQAQQTALELSKQCGGAVDLPRCGSHSETIAEDLALNLARTERYRDAIEIAGLITDASDSNRTLETICVCQAERGDLEGFRQTLARIDDAGTQVRALATGAAAMVSAAATGSGQLEAFSALKQRSAARKTAEKLIHESLQLARRIPPSFERDTAFLWIAVAAKAAGVFDAAAAASLMIQDRPTVELACEAIDRIETPFLASWQSTP